MPSNCSMLSFYITLINVPFAGTQDKQFDLASKYIEAFQYQHHSKLYLSSI